MTQLCLPQEMTSLTEEEITRPISVVKAWTAAGDIAGFDDKQVAGALEMDPTTFSRFKQGSVGIKPEVMLTFMDKVRNELPLHYLAYRRGYYLTRRETELERQVRVRDEKIAKLEYENRFLREFHQGK